MSKVVPLRAGPELKPEAPESGAKHILLGDLLVQSGALRPEELAAALEAQREQDTRLGRILLASRKISAEDLGVALSHQTGLGRVDLRQSPPDRELMRGVDPYLCLELEAVPWRHYGGTRVLAVANPETAKAAIEALGGGAGRVALALATADDIRAAITSTFKGRLRDDARLRCPDAFSCRRWSDPPMRWRLYGGLAAGLAAVATAPLLMLQALMAWSVAANLMTTGLRLAAILARYQARRAPAPSTPPLRLSDHRKLPQVSILVPLLREEAVARRLLDALAAMEYPPALLDIKLVLEEDDAVTRAAITKADLPPTIEVVTVPMDGLRTKPRAMNYALPFCRGEIVGVYDAEDRPDPAQIGAVVRHLRDAPPEVGCVQGQLDFYNSNQNWLSRCFTLEYAIWFRVLLHGVQRLGVPIPLGGTTVFFRRAVLEEIGAWDAHNVTEDADLGMRLARFGYRCEMLDSTTWEEANCRMWPWIKQRSRWLKGYVITWASHMRAPRALLRDLGWRGFLGFQVLFLGAITSYLSLPLFWALWTATAGFGLAFWQTFPAWLMWSFFASMFAGQAVMLTVAMLAARDTGRPGLTRWVLMLPFYWPLGAMAAYRAVAEMFYAPFLWHKTEHGVDVGAEHRPEPPQGSKRAALSFRRVS